MTDKTPARRYTLEQKELALHTLALTGNRYEHACDLLRNHPEGFDVSRQLLHRWATHQLPDRYEEIRTQVSQQVAQRVANQAEEIALAAGNLELQLIQDLEAKRTDMDARDVATAIRNISTTKALNIDKISSPIRGRPTIIHSDRTAEDILKALKALEPGLIIDNPTETITDAELAEDPPEGASG